ncbi:Uncharacterised protein [Porphyromonas cangingivalis]|uniref:PorV/PorQ family protein n=1 Tax=Porphyromonas cangingivalis TaxID=36874 RepID=UPI000D8B2608|nr:PorV/PorQ family protein [Porphyromonas cangingivalis]SPY34957.1 Uncharacterised protein [Porphyromonas cangingivalis]
MKTDLLRRCCLGILILGAIATSNTSLAQTRLLPILESPVDARAAAMGGVALMNTDRSYLYINPTSIVYQDTKFTVSANGVLFPKYGAADGRLKKATISVGQKFFDRHAFYAGFRYQGGLSHKVSTGQFDNQDPLEYNPFDWVADLGYAYRISKRFSVFATGSFIQSYTGRAAYAGAFGIGANYLKDFQISETDVLLNIAARVADFGTPLYYSSSERYTLPSKAELTADLTTLFSKNHKLVTLIGGRSFFMPTNVQVYQANMGAEYTLYDLLSLRAGVQLGNRSTGHWSCGAGLGYKRAKIDFSFLRGLNTTHSDRLVLTLSYNY